jgi:hypothetical protein
MRSNRGANVRFHFACATVCKHLLLDARQRCRDFSLLTRNRGVGKRFVVRADEKLTPCLWNWKRRPAPAANRFDEQGRARKSLIALRESGSPFKRAVDENRAITIGQV